MKRMRILGIGLPSRLAPVLVFACGCSTTSWNHTTSITSGNRLIVETEEQRFKGEPKDAGFSHPAIVAPEGLGALFIHLKYEYPGLLSTSHEPVIDEELIQPLAAAIAEGLKQCGPAQRVRFSAANVHRQFKLLPVGTTTRGVAFVKPAGVLNIAFDLVDDDPDVEAANELHYDEWEDPTRRTISTFRLLPPAGTSLYRDPDGREHGLWLATPFSTITPEPPRATAPAIPPKPPEPEPREPSQGAGEQPKPAEAPGKESGQAPEQPAEKPAKPLTDQERMHRLRYLQDLFERGIIAEDEYRREWNKIFQQY